ncbi:MAG: cyclic di-GMP phosphodiesterase [Solirubrobacteraceae bacterium]|jgi:putative two-component system response regulator|nr:cyclic di-GMP phosphodiesterase [Solirubrobacteraceae bacterium]
MSELLIVDDEHSLRDWAVGLMIENGYECDGAVSVPDAREQLQRDAYALVLVDVNMPGESGMQLLSSVRSEHPGTAVVMVTGTDDLKLAMVAIEQGAYGYMVKPVGAGELLIAVANALHRRQLEAESQRAMDRLQHEIEDRGQQLTVMLEDLQTSQNTVWVSQAETIFRLARLVEFRDEETGFHLQRMSSYCELLARRSGLTADHCEMIRLSSQLHDIGKVAIPDNVLQKRGLLSPPERTVIQRHAEIGYEMLAGSISGLVQMGGVIARSHHERWDGAGYPRGLAGEEIPLEGRIAAVADVFDALTSPRCYRPAFPVGQALETMRAEAGAHFDPRILGAFFEAFPDVEAIRRTYGE